MVDLGVFGDYEKWCGAHCKYLDSDLKNSKVYVANERILKAFSKPGFEAMVAELLKFALPNNDGAPPILMESLAKLANLSAPLSESKIFRLVTSPQKPEKAKAKGASKQLGKAKAKANPKASTPSVLQVGDIRTATYMLDVSNSESRGFRFKYNAFASFSLRLAPYAVNLCRFAERLNKCACL